MSLTENEKDRVAEIVNRARGEYESGHPAYWSGGEPELRLSEVFAALGPEETAFAVSLLEQGIARLEERGPDPIIERVDEARARGGGVRPPR